MDQGVALVVCAAIGAVPATIVALGSWRAANRVQREVATLNESTLGQLAAAIETRRVEAITHDDRTAKEQRHMDDAPIVEPGQGPSR